MNTITGLAMAATGLLLNGCAPSPDYSFVRTWPQEYLVQQQFNSYSAIPIKPLIVVRYAAQIPAEIYNEALNNYNGKSGFGGSKVTNNAYGMMSTEPMPDSLNKVIVHNTYYGIKVGTCLKEHASSHYDVLLEPATVGKLGDRWTYISSYRDLPSTIVIDVMMYVSSISGLAMYNTFGDSVNPFFSIRISPGASPSTKGAAVTNEVWFSILDTDSSFTDKYDARSGIGATLPQFLNTQAIPSDPGVFAPWKSIQGPLPRTLLSMDASYHSGLVTGLPDLDLSFDIDSKGIAINAGDIGNSCYALGKFIHEILNTQSVRDTELNRFASYARFFENPKSDKAVLHTDNTNNDSLISALYQAEITFFSRQDKKLEELLNSAWAETYYAVRVKEKIAKGNYERGMWMATGIMAMGTIAGFSGDVSAMNASNKSAMNLLDLTQQSTLDAINGIQNTLSEMHNLTQDLNIRGESIRATTHADLRNKLLEVYKKANHDMDRHQNVYSD